MEDEQLQDLARSSRRRRHFRHDRPPPDQPPRPGADRELDRAGRAGRPPGGPRRGARQRRPGVLHRARRRPADPAAAGRAAHERRRSARSTRWFDRFRTMPKATIAMHRGHARGGGSELALSLDMRFGASVAPCWPSPRSRLGSFPGGSGTQRLPRLPAGRARSRCPRLPGLSADLAERYGYLNRALPAGGSSGPFVDASPGGSRPFPPRRSPRQARRSRGRPRRGPGSSEENHLFNQTLATDEAQQRMARFLELGGKTQRSRPRNRGPDHPPGGIDVARG